MAGLIFLAALAALVALLVWLSGLLTRGLRGSQDRRFMVRVLIVLGAFPLMLADEIIGKYQFEELCKINGIMNADVSLARGKRVNGEHGESRFISGTIMPIEESDVTFRDVENNELLIRYKNYYAFGGWLMRYTPLSMGSSHSMLFSGNGCNPSDKQKIFDANQISQIN